MIFYRAYMIFGEISYDNGWRKDVINQCLEFGVGTETKPATMALCWTLFKRARAKLYCDDRFNCASPILAKLGELDRLWSCHRRKDETTNFPQIVFKSSMSRINKQSHVYKCQIKQNYLLLSLYRNNSYA